MSTQDILFIIHSETFCKLSSQNRTSLYFHRQDYAKHSFP